MTQSVLLVEDDAATRSQLEAIIESSPILSLAAAVGTVEEGCACLRAHDVDILLTDLGLPDGSGVDLIQRAAQQDSVLSLVITVFGDERHVVEAIRAGAMGYLLKDEAATDVERAISEMVAGGSPISPAIARYLLRQVRPDPSSAASEPLPNLSPREHEVLGYIVKGFTYAEIAELTERSTHTISTHIRKIYRKLAVHSRGEAVYEALQLGLVDSDD
ncbi:MAG: response regulator [Myxococcota bacterium]